MKPKPPFKAFYRNGSVRQEGFRANTDFLIDGGIWRILKGSFESTTDGTQIRMVFTYPNYIYFPLWLLFLMVSIFFLFRHIETASWPVDYNQWMFLIVACGATVLMPLDCRRRNKRFAQDFKSILEDSGILPLEKTDKDILGQEESPNS